MHEGKSKGSELIIFDDGTLYHIDLKRADNIPQNLLLVGAAERVETIAKYFDTITFRHQNRARPELKIICGVYKNTPIAAMSCGMGVGNMEIVLTELHALFEFNHIKNTWSNSPAPVNIIRVGTSGTSLKEIPAGALGISNYSIGLDNLGAFYPRKIKNKIAEGIEKDYRKTLLGRVNPLSYVAAADPDVVRTLEQEARKVGEAPAMTVTGLTTASPGFFGPEGRTVGRLNPVFTLNDFIKDIVSFKSNNLKIINHEMETSILFRMANEILGYRAGAICLILDNLSSDEVLEASFVKERMDRCITIALEAMVDLASSASRSSTQ